MNINAITSENYRPERRKPCSLKVVFIFALIAIGAVGAYFLPTPKQPTALELRLPHYHNMSRHSTVYYQPQLPAPLPQPHPLRKIAVEGWIQGHCPFQRDFARKIMQRVRHISHGEFKTALLSSIRHFNHQIESLPFQERDYIAIAWPKKSNGWVTDLALPHLSHLPTAIVNINRVSEYLYKHPQVKRVVFFDDAIYTGLQMKTNIELTLDYKMRVSNDSSFKIHVVAPFITNPANFVSSKTRNIVEIAEHSQIRTLTEMFSHSELESLESRYDIHSSEQSAMAMTYFDHKVPDFVSFPNFLTKSSTGDGAFCQPQCMDEPLIDEFEPPYKEINEVL